MFILFYLVKSSDSVMSILTIVFLTVECQSIRMWSKILNTCLRGGSGKTKSFDYWAIPNLDVTPVTHFFTDLRPRAGTWASPNLWVPS